MPTDTSVKFIHSGMIGTPSLPSTAGALLTVLRACLINGIAGPAITNIIISNGIATVNCSASIPFEKDIVSLVSGSSVTALNGEKKVLSTAGNSYTFDATGVADQTVTGTITHKVAPLGWSEAFTGTSTLAVFRSTNSSSPKTYLKIDDSNSSTNFCARVLAYERMTDISTGFNQFPNPYVFGSAVPGLGLYWSKASTLGSFLSPWMVWGNDKTFYYWCSFLSNGYAGCTHGFGDFKKIDNSDNYNSFLHGSLTDLVAFTNSDPGVNTLTYMSNTRASLWLQRASHGIGTSVWAYSLAPIKSFFSGSAYSGNNNSFTNFPDFASGELFSHPFFILGENGIRGEYPGLRFVGQNVSNSYFNMRDTVTNVAGSPGRSFRVLKDLQTRALLFDVTGPW